MILHKLEYDWSGKSRSGWPELSTERNASIGHRPTMLAAAKLARPFSAARLATPRHISTSLPRRSDALFAVRPREILECGWPVTYPIVAQGQTI